MLANTVSFWKLKTAFYPGIGKQWKHMEKHMEKQWQHEPTNALMSSIWNFGEGVNDSLQVNRYMFSES